MFVGPGGHSLLPGCNAQPVRLLLFSNDKYAVNPINCRFGGVRTAPARSMAVRNSNQGALF